MEAVLASKFVNKVHADHWGKFTTEGLVPVNDIYKPFWRSVNRYQVYYGGRGSGKSKFIAQKLVNQCIEHSRFKCIYVRKGRVDIKESMYDILVEVIIEQGLFFEFKFNSSSLRITHKKTGNCFIARGLDDPQKSKSINSPTCIWCEEATELDQEDFTTLDQNLRSKKGHLQAYISFNPIHEEHWIRSYFFSSEDKHKATDRLRDIVVLRTTLYHNSFINQEQYAADLTAGAAGNLNIIRVVLEGDWGQTENGNPWLHAFEENRHVKDVAFLPDYPVYLSFDFNNDPFACLAFQMSPTFGTLHSFISIINEFVGEFKIEDMLQRVQAEYPRSIIYITGDRSGNNEDLGRNQTLYQMIASILQLNKAQVNTNDSNITHADSRILCNAMWKHYPNLYVHSRCKNFIADCRKATVDGEKNVPSALKKDREYYKMDAFDAGRYFFQTYFLKFAKEQYFRALNKKPEPKPIQYPEPIKR